MNVFIRVSKPRLDGENDELWLALAWSLLGLVADAKEVSTSRVEVVVMVPLQLVCKTMLQWKLA